MARTLTRNSFILKNTLTRFRARFTVTSNDTRKIKMTYNASTLTLKLVTYNLNPNSRILLPTGAFVTALLKILHAKTAPIFISYSHTANLVSLTTTRLTVARHAGTVVPIRLCNRLISPRTILSLTNHRNLLIFRSTTRTRLTRHSNCATKSVNATTTFDFCPDGGLNTLNSNNVMIAARRSATRALHDLHGCNTTHGCCRARTRNAGDHLSALRTTVLTLGLPRLSN